MVAASPGLALGSCDEKDKKQLLHPQKHLPAR